MLKGTFFLTPAIEVRHDVRVGWPGFQEVDAAALEVEHEAMGPPRVGCEVAGEERNATAEFVASPSVRIPMPRCPREHL